MSRRLDRTHPGKIDRRKFLLGTAAGTTGLVIAFHLPEAGAAAAATSARPKELAPNAFLRVGTDGAVTVVVHKSEMGQGVWTGIPMMVAEELGADWASVRVEQAGVGREFVMKGDFLQQVTGGSTSTRHSWKPLRKAGAQAREMLIGAAAKRWKAKRGGCRTERGAVVGPDGARLGFGELAAEAARLKVPRRPRLKDPKDFTLLGTSPARTDLPAKVDGSAIFGVDVRRPGMLTAMVARCPVFGGRVRSFDASEALAVPGVRHVFEISTGVAVVADGYWQARTGRAALKVEWDDGSNANNDQDEISRLLAVAGTRRGKAVRREGKAARALESAAKVIDATYELPLLAHATMEPQNCTADVRPGFCEVWGPVQNQTKSRNAAARYSGVPKSAVRVHTTFLGGGFGRRLEWDFVEEAVQASKLAGVPVMVMWSREDDMRHSVYRPPAWHSLRGGLDADGNLTAWWHRLVTPSIIGRVLPLAAKLMTDPTSVEGAKELPYAVPNLRVEYVRQEVGVPAGFWRSVGHSHNAFAVESFFDELAVAAGVDPVELRRRLLAKRPRHLAVLDLAAEKAGWSTPPPEGRARGVALHASYGSIVAYVVEVSVDDRGRHRVHRVVCAADCGRILHPAMVESQMQSAVVFGLSALDGAITIAKGRVRQGNFHDYRLLRMNEMPKVEVHLVPSIRKPSGVGEPGVPPIAPAVTNAIHALTGTRIRKLPIDAELLRNRSAKAASDAAAAEKP